MGLVYCHQNMAHTARHGVRIISHISLVIMALLVRTEAKDVPQLTNRNLIQIYELMRVKTNCSALSLAHLTDYGNWCGLGNNGLDPVDDMDACCQSHDFCYSNIIQSHDCSLPHPILVAYDWKALEDGSLICDDCSSSREDPVQSKVCSCETCMCDLQLATCLHSTNNCPSPLFGLSRKTTTMNSDLLRRDLN